MDFTKKHWGFLTAIILCLIAAALRLRIYGDLRLSIANNDTVTYVASSEVKLNSWEAFTGRRLFTMNVIYQFLRPDSGYEILVNGSYDTTKRQIQPGFVNVALLQAILSTFAWTILILAIASAIRNNLLKIAASLILLIFAFVPQVADWDSILTSESPTFSLFALQAGLLIFLACRFATKPTLSIGTGLLLLGWLITVFLWTFLRDTNLYGLLVDIVMLLGLFLFPSFRRQKYLYVIVILLAGIFILGWISSSRSQRSVLVMKELYGIVILGTPSRVDFMQSQGMPAPGSPEFDGWFVKNAKNAYLRFLIAHPGYVVTIYFRDTLKAFYENIQPYFNAPDLFWRNALIPLGDALHPESATPVFLDIILLAGIWTMGLKKKSADTGRWIWMTSWMFFFASINMFVVIFGDTYGLNRHALLATTAYRFYMWLFLLVLIDLSLLSEKEPVDDSKIQV